MRASVLLILTVLLVMNMTVLGITAVVGQEENNPYASRELFVENNEDENNEDEQILEPYEDENPFQGEEFPQEQEEDTVLQPEEDPEL